jgi:SAM-dependent methyltransferase
MSGAIEFTGERFIPGTRGEIWVEHWHRYHFAARWAAGRRVLDVACGEGYGTALLARGAARVTGVDLAPAAIAHARATYAALANVEFVEASCTRLPLADASFDVVVSFETLEHIAEQEAFLDEAARVLAPGGVLVLSCPNKLEYSDKRQFANEFHVKELYREELARLVGARFPDADWYGQRPSFFSVIAPEAPGPASGELREVSEEDPANAAGALAHPLYFLLVASRSRASLDALPPLLSVLSDRGDWVHKDYEKVMRDLGGCAKEREHAVNLVGERDRTIEFMTRDAADYQRVVAELQAGIVELKAGHAREVERIVTERDALLAARDATIAAKDHEITRRGGIRWWLVLLLYRFGILKHPPV